VARDGEWKTFDSKSFQERAEVMYLYLVEGHNMEVTADIYYRNNNPQYSKHVSLITRCYNFSGRNKGVFSGNRFGDLVTKDDILAFVKEYPDGIESESSIKPGSGIEMEAFLKNRIEKRLKKAQKGVHSPITENIGYSSQSEADNMSIARMDRRKVIQSSMSTSFSNTSSVEDNAQNSKSSSKTKDDDSMIIGLVIGIVVLLLIIAFIFNWFGIRTAVVGFLIDALMYVWIFGMLILIILVLFNKIEAVENKGIIQKIVFLLICGVVSFVLLVFLLDLIVKIK
jgi:hypothetical protein